jgi:hypothetical protein
MGNILPCGVSKSIQSENRDFTKLNWYDISRNESISIDFLEENIDKLDLHGISQNKSIPIYFFEKLIDLEIDRFQLIS